jgi:hypothetical protein
MRMTAGHISRNCNKQITRAGGRKADARVICVCGGQCGLRLLYHQQAEKPSPDAPPNCAMAPYVFSSYQIVQQQFPADTSQ